MKLLGICALCRSIAPRGPRGLTLCPDCLRERSADESTRAVGVALGADRGRAVKLAEGTERGFSARCGEPTRSRPAIVREVIGAALVVALPVILWFIAAVVAAGEVQ